LLELQSTQVTLSVIPRW